MRNASTAAVVLAAALGAALAVPTAAAAAPQAAEAATATRSGQQADGAGRVRAALGADATGTEFVPVTPKRVLDTRSAIGVPGTTPVGTGGTISVNLSSSVPAEAVSVVLNVTVVTAAKGSFVTVFPTGADRPTASNLNVYPNSVRPNAATVTLGTNRSVSLFAQNGPTHLIADLAGYYVAGSGALYNSLGTPVRLLDTREPSGGGKIGAGATRALPVGGAVPASATAVVMNLTGLNATQGSFVTAWPNGATRPTASSLNLVPNQVAPNLVVVPIGTGRTVNLYNLAGSVDVVADLAGYFDPTAGAQFFPVDPIRYIDTRDYSPVGPLEYVNFYDPYGDFEGFSGAVLNLTGTEPTSGTYLTAYPDPAHQDPPFTSNLNLAPAETAANLVFVGLGSDPEARFGVLNRFGYVHQIWDFAGFFGPVLV
ncbi:hypothetical protein [Actinokineospora bangkokensis]|uniref:Uncharacterized protein n=1 Tax=Actinokineospora bangkokensis TaxID=1193682 RepID=A0A1Q9LM96_9PSEU|nr:hypothetical protein [Actinokineospora bangkokensis]OLR93135.1 hypothetical protein BJP25_00640 [Actinokineospora bangkokensis]